MTDSLIDSIGRERAHALMRQAVQDAIAELHAAGLPAIGAENGRVCKFYPDGTKVYVDEEEAAGQPHGRSPAPSGE
ncbi:MAG TPA: hypothetical protein VLH10_27670 [Yinghuangia sp.]|uniref:hypothetical protein n=1 Tax=Yinghuangia sp. YIM S10712 TaxID=3436930 RepID=UPI002C55BF30|nr:hypothetical protein [Yinghuangia sp.]